MSQDSREIDPDEPFDQKNLALDYVVKWQKIARSTTRINRTSASQAIKAAYEALGAQKPEILFFDSSSAAMDMLKNNPEILKEDEHWDWHRRIQIQLIIRPDQHITNNIGRKNILSREQNEQSLRSIPDSTPRLKLLRSTSLLYWAQFYVWRFDFAYSVLGCEYCDRDPEKWEALKRVVEHCGWFWATHKVCVVSDRPVKLLFKDYFPHAEGEPAIVYADGSFHYAHDGIEIPEKYGEVCSPQWKTEWLLEEKNFALQALLIETIGYTRILQELPVTKIDFTEKYILWQINTIESESIYLLEIINSTKNENLFFIVPLLGCYITYPQMFPELPGNKIDSEDEFILWKIGNKNEELLCLVQHNYHITQKSFRRVPLYINSIIESAGWPSRE